MKQASRKILSLLLSLTLLCGLCVPSISAAEGGFSDTQGHWAEAAIHRWSGYGVVQGYGDTFRPDASVTRAQMATILANVLGLTEANGNPFNDVADGAWYTPGILRCYAAGVMQGDNSGHANPDRLITRQEAMVMLGRALCIAPEKAPDLSAFTDADSVGEWAAPLVEAMVRSGMVGGVGNNRLDPGGDMSRAALLTVLDRAVVQYVNKPGSYELTNKAGIVLVAAGDVTLSGKTSANILVTPAADSKSLTFDKATVTGSITVQADGANVTAKDSKLPEIITTGTGTTVEQPKATTGGGSSGGGSSGGGGGSSGGGGGGGGSVVSDLTVSEAKTVTGGTYKNVTIAASVGDGTVTLGGVTIQGTLTVNGGGSSTVNLTSCTVGGKVVLDKTGGQAPRLNLTNTPVAAIEAVRPAILEADAASAITAVTAKANVEVKGANTAVASITVPTAVSAPVEVKVTAGTVANVEAKSETSVTGASGSIASVVAEAPVTVASDAVKKVEVPATAGSGVTVDVTGSAGIEVEVNSTNGAAITAEDTSKVEVSTTLDTPPENITIGGTPVTHIHRWDEGKVTMEATCKMAGVKTYTCTAEGCTDPTATKAENIPALPHTKVIDPAVAATCTTDGKTEGVHCSVCDTVLTPQETVPALGHKWGAWTADGENHTRVCANDASHTETEAHTEVVDAAVDATCTEAGKTEGKHCSTCNAIITAQEEIPALGHDFIGDYLNDADGHWHKCTRCDATDEKTAHTYDAADCTQTATCTACGYEKAAGTHTWGKWEKVDETNHKHTCASCGTEDTAAHTWDDGVVTTEPTEDTEGVKTFTCSACGATKTEKVPVTPETFAVTNIKFETYVTTLGCISWEGPVPTGMNGIHYVVEATGDSGNTWRLLGTVTFETKCVLFVPEGGNFHQVKITTMDGKDEKATVTEDLNINISATSNTSTVAAVFTPNEADDKKVDISLSGLTADTYYYLYFAKSLDPLTSRGVFSTSSNNDGTSQFTLTPQTGEIENGYYLVVEFVDFVISDDGKTASYTAQARGEWAQCTPEISE